MKQHGFHYSAALSDFLGDLEPPQWTEQEREQLGQDGKKLGKKVKVKVQRQHVWSWLENAPKVFLRDEKLAQTLGMGVE